MELLWPLYKENLAWTLQDLLGAGVSARNRVQTYGDVLGSWHKPADLAEVFPEEDNCDVMKSLDTVVRFSELSL